MPRHQVFISYSHRDKRWRDDLETHLKPYLRGGIITSWSDQQIAPGSKWFKEIQSALANSKVVVLLVSPDFLASDFIHEHELGPLLKEAEQGGVKILWVPVHESAYRQTALKNYQAVLDPGKPLANMTEADRNPAWVSICEEIEKAVSRYHYHLFISYKHGDWTPWVMDIFRPQIERYLQPEIEEKLEIFYDERIEDGKSWPIDLSYSLACSRLLLPVLSVEYFGSDWCRQELACMLEREARLGFRQNRNAEGLIVPIWLFDGDKFPNVVRDIQAPKFHEFALRSIPRGRLENKFIQAVREHVQKIVRLLYNVVPEHDSAWFALDGQTVLSNLTSCVAHNAQQKLSNP